jgi:uroporphyrinogen-III synthase
VHVVVTREAGHNEVLKSWLPDDATVREVPLTMTRYLDDDSVRSALTSSEYFGRYRALVVTSARSAAFRELAMTALDPNARVFAVGTASASDGDVVGEGGAAELAPKIDEGPVLFLGARSMREELPALLRAKGLEVTSVACYETLPVALSSEDEAALARADVVFIGAPSAWLVGAPFVPETAWVVVPGATTAAAVRQSHDRVLEGWGPELGEVLRAL